VQLREAERSPVAAVEDQHRLAPAEIAQRERTAVLVGQGEIGRHVHRGGGRRLSRHAVRVPEDVGVKEPRNEEGEDQGDGAQDLAASLPKGRSHAERAQHDPDPDHRQVDPREIAQDRESGEHLVVRHETGKHDQWTDPEQMIASPR